MGIIRTFAQREGEMLSMDKNMRRKKPIRLGKTKKVAQRTNSKDIKRTLDFMAPSHGWLVRVWSLTEPSQEEENELTVN